MYGQMNRNMRRSLAGAMDPTQMMRQMQTRQGMGTGAMPPQMQPSVGSALPMAPRPPNAGGVAPLDLQLRQNLIAGCYLPSGGPSFMGQLGGGALPPPIMSPLQQAPMGQQAGAPNLQALMQMLQQQQQQRWQQQQQAMPVNKPVAAPVAGGVPPGFNPSPMFSPAQTESAWDYLRGGKYYVG